MRLRRQQVECSKMASVGPFDLIHGCARTFSQPTIHRSPSTSKAEEDVEATSSMYKRRRNTADITAGGDKTLGMEPLEREFADQRLSASMGEVLTHSDYEDEGRPTMASRCVESLESTRSLSYLEWVHEKQFRRMQTRSEWFLSPATPARTSKSADFRQNYAPNTLNIPKNLEMVSSSEEMQISPKRVENEEEMTPRQLQESTTTLKQTPVQTPQTAKSVKEIFMLQSGPILPAVVAVSPRVVSSTGVARKRSWRTHYVRPNKSFDQEELVAVEKSVHPRRSSTTTVSRRQSGTFESNSTTPRADNEKNPETGKNA
uniref:Uncharacterized protein n=1 Tax=Panagrolaimus sp. JU765 TaxID=591449 RepID=A0AC34QBG5_9BILA